jgi:hypothetical protein
MTLRVSSSKIIKNDYRDWLYYVYSFIDHTNLFTIYIKATNMTELTELQKKYNEIEELINANGILSDDLYQANEELIELRKENARLQMDLLNYEQKKG